MQKTIVTTETTVEESPFMSLREIAEYVGVDQRTARRWYDSGDFPKVYIFGKRKLLFKREDVDIWIETKMER